MAAVHFGSLLLGLGRGQGFVVVRDLVEYLAHADVDVVAHGICRAEHVGIDVVLRAQRDRQTYDRKSADQNSGEYQNELHRQPAEKGLFSLAALFRHLPYLSAYSLGVMPKYSLKSCEKYL